MARVRSHLKLARARNQFAVERELANRELDAFSYSVAHDLRAPLRTIDGFSEILLEDYAERLDEQGLRHLGVIRNSAQRMAQLIDDLLYLAKVSRRDARRTELDLSARGRAIASRLQDSEPNRHVSLEIQADVSVDADPALLTIALENLLGNAWKFT